jgi:type VI protein secretion system component Hcp
MRIFQAFSLIATLLVTSGFSSATLAQATDIYADFSGITGDVTADRFEGRTELLSFEWGFSRPIEWGNYSPIIGRTVANEISIWKRADSSSAGLAGKLLQGGPSTVVISFVWSGGGGDLRETVRVELCEAFISSISTSSGDDYLEENLTVAFKALKITYFDPDPKAGGAGDSVAWDFIEDTPGNCNP